MIGAEWVPSVDWIHDRNGWDPSAHVTMTLLLLLLLLQHSFVNLVAITSWTWCSTFWSKAAYQVLSFPISFRFVRNGFPPASLWGGNDVAVESAKRELWNETSKYDEDVVCLSVPIVFQSLKNLLTVYMFFVIDIGARGPELKCKNWCRNVPLTAGKEALEDLKTYTRLQVLSLALTLCASISWRQTISWPLQSRLWMSARNLCQRCLPRDFRFLKEMLPSWKKTSSPRNIWGVWPFDFPPRLVLRIFNR